LEILHFSSVKFGPSWIHEGREDHGVVLQKIPDFVSEDFELTRSRVKKAQASLSVVPLTTTLP
jgi:hypothetical protein